MPMTNEMLKEIGESVQSIIESCQAKGASDEIIFLAIRQAIMEHLMAGGISKNAALQIVKATEKDVYKKLPSPEQKAAMKVIMTKINQ